MNSDQHDQALAYVLGELDPHAAAALEAQAKCDPQLRAAIRELEEGVAAGVRALPPHRVPATAFRTLERRLDSVAAIRPEPVRRAEPFRWAFLGGLAALLVAGISIGGYELIRGQRQPTIFVAELGTGRAQIRPVTLAMPASNRDGRFMQLASLAERLWNSPAEDENAAGTSDGYTVFDPATNQGFIAVREVPAVPARQRYHLWFVDHETGKLHDAGPLPLDRATRGMFFFSLPAAAGRPYRQPSFFVTVEDASAPAPEDVPRGKVVLGKRI